MINYLVSQIIADSRTLDQIKSQSREFRTSEKKFFNDPLQNSYDHEIDLVAKKLKKATGDCWKNLLTKLYTGLKAADEKQKKIAELLKNEMTEGETKIFDENWIGNLYNQKKSSPSGLSSVLREYQKLNLTMVRLQNGAFTCRANFFGSVIKRDMPKLKSAIEEYLVEPPSHTRTGGKVNGQVFSLLKSVSNPGKDHVKTLIKCYKEVFKSFYNERTSIYNNIFANYINNAKR